MADLGFPKPDLFLGVGSASQGVQTARIISRAEKTIKEIEPDLVMVEGDTNSVLGTALAAAKLRVKVGHVEAGCRSGDRTMTEEMNRTLTSDLADLQFAPTMNCKLNLLREGIPRERIHLTGHPIVDLLAAIQPKIDRLPLSIRRLTRKKYYFSTLHREENVERREVLESILAGLSRISAAVPLIMALHPRTSRRIKQWGLQSYLSNTIASGPVPFLESLRLINSARAVLTDSGGIQQEAALLGVPCVTLRNCTEWVETTSSGVNFLAHTQVEIVRRVNTIEQNYEAFARKFLKAKGLFGSLGASRRIVDIVEAQMPR
jgi:UDP-N-acetylglucosamine 2-epimerase (non-hydrolysing)